MKLAEQQMLPDQGVKEAVAKVFESWVEQLLQGNPEQQQRGREIAELVKARRSFDAPAMIHPNLQKLSTLPLFLAQLRTQNASPRPPLLAKFRVLYDGKDSVFL